MTALLEVDDIEVRYGAIRALKGVSFEVNEGEVVALLGANGAGKTTTQKTVSGMMRPALGEIRFDGDRIDGLPAHELIHRGICHVPEGRRVFPRMTVAENLDMGAFRFKRADPEMLARVYELFPRLKERIAQFAGTLSGGEQQMLAIGRGLMAEPKLIILDEPSLGLSPLLVEELFALIARIRGDGVAVLVVEQNVVQSLEIRPRLHSLRRDVRDVRLRRQHRRRSRSETCLPGTLTNDRAHPPYPPDPEADRDRARHLRSADRIARRAGWLRSGLRLRRGDRLYAAWPA